MDRYELAWAAGFFDGEGWANAVGQRGRDTRQPQARINQADPSGIPEVLLRFQRAVGNLGRISGPKIIEGREPIYRWEISSRGDVEILHHLLLPWLGQVKLQEFANALDRPAAASRSVNAADEWVAWAAGLFDGEGSAYLLRHRTHEGYKVGETRVTQSSAVGRPEVLTRYRTVMQRGRIYGPYKPARPGELPVYRWCAASLSDVVDSLRLVLPHVTAVKTAQVSGVLAVLTSQPPLPRGRPDWGNRKSHCIRGHEYATARIRPYRPRGMGFERRDNKQCLVCVREAAKQKSQLKKSAVDDDRR